MKIFLTILLIIILIALFALTYLFVLRQPTNQNDWQTGTEILPIFHINGSIVTVNNIRDYHYATDKSVSQNYISRQFQSDQISQVWFVVEPFSKWNGIAHTYLVFDFDDGQTVAVSVEARMTKQQQFSPFMGAFNQYQLIYLWGTEKDLTVRRVLVENNKLQMYRLKLSAEAKQQLFLQLAETSHQLEKTPRFYNTLISNCTNELAYAANQVKANSIPWNIGYIFPGYALSELYKLGFIETTDGLDQLIQNNDITAFVRSNYDSNNFSKDLRATLDH